MTNNGVRKSAFAGATLGAALLLATAARAALVISTDSTQNVTCSAGVCTATAKKATLNVADLANMLAAGDLTVTTGTAAKDIRLSAPLSWTSKSQLTLDARRAIVLQQEMTVGGRGGLTLHTKYAKTGGYFWFERKGRIEFWDLRSNLVINRKSYVLVSTVKELADAVSKNGSGYYALAADYDAAPDGAYAHSPVPELDGVFDGLGNTISNVDIESSDSNANIGFFGKAGGLVRDMNLANLNISATGANNVIGGLAADGTELLYSSVSGIISGSGYIGGLHGLSAGNIGYSHASVDITDLTGPAGGLVGDLYRGGANLWQSYSTGAIHGGDNWSVGGLVGGVEHGNIVYSYAIGPVTGGANAEVGGLIGSKAVGFVANAYATGSLAAGSGGCIGGYAGSDGDGAINSYDYWDTDTSGTDQASCAGGVHGVAGLTTQQFKAGLPDGFDPTVWGELPNINNGYPYLLANPPPDNAPAKSAHRSR